MEYTEDLTSQSADDDLPTYIIYRDVRPGEQFDPSAPLHFLPPKDSDELFDALRFAFPHLKTHSERLRDATIKFLLEEQQAYTSSTTPRAPVTTQPTTQTFAISSAPTASSSSNTSNVWSHATIGTKGKFKHVPSSQSSNQSSNLLTKDMPPKEDMTGVFSISSVQPKQHSRRRMTEREKAEYRQRRMAKACDKCAKRKRKCIHNLAGSSSPQPEHAISRQSSSKATSDVSSPTSIDSQDQSQREASQEGAPMSDSFANDELTFDYSGNQLMLGVAPLPVANLSNWYIGIGSAFWTSPVNSYFDSTSLDTIPRGSGTAAHAWTPQDQLMDDWPTQSLRETTTSPILHMGDFLQFDEVVSGQRQVPWSQASTTRSVACAASPHGEEEYVLSEDNEWCISRQCRLLAGKQTVALEDTSFAFDLQTKRWEIDGIASYNHHDGHYPRERPQQTPEREPVAAKHTSQSSEQFDVQETFLRKYAWRCEVSRWILEAMLKNASTIGTALTIVMCLLRQGDHCVVLHEEPTLELPSDVNENEGKKDVASYQS